MLIKEKSKGLKMDGKKVFLNVMEKRKEILKELNEKREQARLLAKSLRDLDKYLGDHLVTLLSGDEVSKDDFGYSPNILNK